MNEAKAVAALAHMVEVSGDEGKFLEDLRAAHEAVTRLGIRRGLLAAIVGMEFCHLAGPDDEAVQDFVNVGRLMVQQGVVTLAESESAPQKVLDS